MTYLILENISRCFNLDNASCRLIYDHCGIHDAFPSRWESNHLYLLDTYRSRFTINQSLHDIAPISPTYHVRGGQGFGWIHCANRHPIFQHELLHNELHVHLAVALVRLGHIALKGMKGEQWICDGMVHMIPTKIIKRTIRQGLSQ